MTIKNLFFISILLLLGFCLLASAEVSEEDAAVVKQFVPEGCQVDAIEKADLDGDGKPELVFAYTGENGSDLKGLIVLKWNGAEYMKQWECHADEVWHRRFYFLQLEVQDMTNDSKSEILLYGDELYGGPHGGPHTILAVFTWDGKAYKLLGPNDAEWRKPQWCFYFAGEPIAPGSIRVYEHIYSSSPFEIDQPAYPRTYKWNGSKFVLYGIRNGKTFGACEAEKPLKIDGKLDDWGWGLEGTPVYTEDGPVDHENGFSLRTSGMLSTYVELDEVLFRPKNWRGILDLGAWFDTQWDDKTLYIVVQVADDKLVQEWQKASLFKGDHVEIWFDTDLTGDFDVAKANGDDFQIGISPGNFKKIKPSVYCWLPKAKEGNIKEAEVSAKRTDDGYILEAAIPFQFLGVEPEDEKMLGFTLLVSDTDEKEKPQKCMIGTSPQYKWGNPTTWDNFVLE